MRPEHVTRRSFVQISLGAAAVGVLVASGAPAVVLRTLRLTPAVADADEALTPAQTEGPYFKRDSPERWSLLEADTTGTRLVISGRVLDRFAQPQAAALLDFWQADDAGNYDNVTYRLRGHQFTDDDGAFTLETVLPGLYTGRTRHVHVKVQAPNGPVLTSQLYFPNEPQNQRDGLYDPALTLPIQGLDDGSQAAAFDFVINTA